MRQIKLSNTLTGKKDLFKSIEENKVKLYACGITPYDYSHVGHARLFMFVDTLVRLLRFIGYDVNFVRNITDIDDKILQRAKDKLGDMMRYKEISEKFTKMYDEEMLLLNCVKPDHEPKVTEHMDVIIKFVEGLVEKGCAYVVDNDVYFDVSTFKDYGELSGKSLEDLMSGIRVDVDPRKKNPGDFALWKGNKESLFWKSPWGYGRPGWHIECSAMIREYLGDTIDIHCGGMDLIFPHHENEIAQSESFTGKTFVNYWVHTAFLNINKEKMSKSLGNILTIKSILEKYDPMVLRFYFLQHHYHKPMDFSFETLDSSKVAYERLMQIFSGFDEPENKFDLENEIVKEIIDTLCDDVNTPKMLGIIFDNLSEIKNNESLSMSVFNILSNVCGLKFAPIKAKEITPEIEKLIQEREEARREKSWELADKLREELKKLGYEVKDPKIK